jgi:tetratricopeptide (TPR) repeat protein
MLLALVLAFSGAAESFVWVDEAGVTHITNDPERVPDAVRERPQTPESLRSLWNGPLDRAAPPANAVLDQDEERTQRQLRSAVADLQRGENARAAAVLRALLREQPGRPEPHWYLAQLDRYRGRYDSAATHLEAFLATAGDDLEIWRQSARTRLSALADERRLAERTRGAGAGPWPALASPNFRVELDPDLGRAAPDYASTVLGYLEEARVSVAERLGAQPDEPMGVVFYGRAAYDEAHRDRFSFRTVGFFDGRIHVVSAAHPAGELRALLFHEYTHAVFRERTGGDTPYWLNEGLAELSERESRGQPGLTRSERGQLERRIDAREWIPLRRLAPSFGGLEDEEARIAYLESTAAADWLGGRTDRAVRGRLIERIGAGVSTDEALHELLGMDTDAVDRAVREWIQSEFAGRLPRPADVVE